MERDLLRVEREDLVRDAARKGSPAEPDTGLLEKIGRVVDELIG